MQVWSRKEPNFFTLQIYDVYDVYDVTMSTMFIPDTSASDFEEQLGHGVGKNAGDALKFMTWLEIVKKRTSSGSGMEKESQKK